MTDKRDLEPAALIIPGDFMAARLTLKSIMAIKSLFLTCARRDMELGPAPEEKTPEQIRAAVLTDKFLDEHGALTDIFLKRYDDEGGPDDSEKYS